MAQVNILSGIYTNAASDFRTSYPRNMVPIPAQTGTSLGYLRPAEGIVQYGFTPGIDRGGINWNGVCYRVMGNSFISIASDGTITVIGFIAGTGQVSFDYSFDLLGIAAGGRPYFYADGVLNAPGDADFGNVLDVIWVDGYFMFTDGTSIIVTELLDPFSVNPLKYGSSEVDPDPIKRILKLRNEPYAINRYTIEVFQNVGGSLFPFQRIQGAYIMRGSIGRYTCAIFLDSIAFLGGGRNEAPAIWLASNGNSVNISTREIDQIVANYTETQLADSVMEAVVREGQKLLYLHLPDQTVVYDAAASQVLNQPVWHILTSSIVGNSTYRARNFVYCYDKWLVGDPTSPRHGYMSDTVATHYGDTVGWDFNTSILYNGSKGAIFREIELVCLTGRTALGVNPTIWTSYSTDGMSWSQEKPRTLGMTGQTMKRITWYQQGFMRNWRVQKFRGTSDTLLAVSRLEMQLEPLMA